MQYQIKRKINKVDSQQFRNLLIPEIDSVLNEAMDIFIKIVAFPRIRTQLGFEKTQRTIDDIRSLVESEHNPTNQFDIENSISVLPDDYKFYISSHVIITKGDCEAKVDTSIVQHDDNSESNSHYKSSFEWRKVNAEFNSEGIRFYNDGSFETEKFCLSYIRKPKYIHNAEDFTSTGYKLPSGEIVSGKQDCELPEHTHGEIIDIAAMILSGEMNNPGVEFAMAKLKLNQLN